MHKVYPQRNKNKEVKVIHDIPSDIPRKYAILESPAISLREDSRTKSSVTSYKFKNFHTCYYVQSVNFLADNLDSFDKTRHEVKEIERKLPRM